MNTQNYKILGNWESRHLKLLLVIFGVALIAKSGVLSRGFAIDDYSFGQGFTKGELGFFLTQGRFLLAGIDWVIDALGVNINDLYVSLGLAALFLQAALIVAILRFVGAADAPGAMVVGSAMVVHPYLAEILTFRMVLPGYCAAAALSILAMEAASRTAAGYRSYAFSLLATLGMLFVYQGFLNYFAVAIIFAYLFGAFAKIGVGSHPPGGDHSRRAFVLTLICAFSVFLFLAILSVAKRIGSIEPTGRAKFIEWQAITTRLGQIQDLFLKVFWQSEPVTPQWVKMVIVLLSVVAILALIPGFIGSLRNSRYFGNTVGIVLAAFFLIPATVGVIVLFKDWWPVPRVLPQVPIIVGLLWLLAYPALQNYFPRIPSKAFIALILCVVVAFIFINNQVFADQQRLNSWDRAEANRIIARIEEQPDFSRIESVFVSGGSWRHSGRLRTIQGDMNISAFSPDYSKLPLLLEVSGYNFSKASGSQIVAGESYCSGAKPWPDKTSVSVIDNLAVVCLPK
ncbi:glucosyltransferase domain-containing protein [Variovorax boronicumulans]|uniref:glucosyltransferase domain-containing protein n=1 Tax=Variovorax boronicumulans TaxID=436515 RepID=UPI0027804701|nr:glucosyltransferase domain-containing protein [Variovorax boronicumulans]MDQ0042403.1 hypothetical protein [Variovorax boronicumulans]